MKEAHLTSDALHDENAAEGVVPSVEELSRTIDLRMLVRRELLTSSVQAAPPARVEAVHRVAQLINDYDPMLLETDVYLAFRLRQLELLELIREKQLEQALLFAEVFAQYSLCRLLLASASASASLASQSCSLSRRLCATKWRGCRSCCRSWSEHWPYWHLKIPQMPLPILAICMEFSLIAT